MNTAKKLCLFLLAAILVCSSLSMCVFADSYFQGAGTSDNPFLIQSADDLLTLASLTSTTATVNTYNKCHYLLTSDLDLAGKSFSGIDVIISNSLSYIFGGVFDGGGHVIRNMTINTGKSRGLGLFDLTGGGAVIKNLGIENASVTNTSAAAGALVGYAVSDTTIENCFVNGAVLTPGGTGKNCAGFVGCGNTHTTNITITNCYALNIASGGTMKAYPFFSRTSSNEAQSGAYITNCYTDSELPASRYLTKSTPVNYYDKVNDLSVSAELLGNAFIKNNSTTYHNGLPVLAWEESRLPETVLPEVQKNSYESVLSYKDAQGNICKKATADEDETDFYSMRFVFDVTGATPADNFGAYIIPFDVFSDSGKAKTVTVNYQPTAAETSFTADLLQIPYASRFRTIYVVPFVNSVAEMSESFKASAVPAE